MKEEKKLVIMGKFSGFRKVFCEEYEQKIVWHQNASYG